MKFMQFVKKRKYIQVEANIRERPIEYTSFSHTSKANSIHKRFSLVYCLQVCYISHFSANKRLAF